MTEAQGGKPGEKNAGKPRSCQEGDCERAGVTVGPDIVEAVAGWRDDLIRRLELQVAAMRTCVACRHRAVIAEREKREKLLKAIQEATRN